jgi:hypothetical protein
MLAVASARIVVLLAAIALRVPAVFPPASAGISEEELQMSQALINLIIQAIGGAVGGNAIGSTAKNLNLGPLWNTVAGALGGAGGGSILSAILPALGGGPGGLDIAAAAGQLVGGGVTGAIVTAIVGIIVNSMRKV